MKLDLEQSMEIVMLLVTIGGIFRNIGVMEVRLIKEIHKTKLELLKIIYESNSSIKNKINTDD